MYALDRIDGSPKYRCTVSGSIVGFIRSEMPDLREQIRAWATVDGRGPADEVGTPAKQCEDLPVPVGAGSETAVDAPSACRARFERRRGRGDAVRVFAMLPSGLLACRPGVRSANQCLPRQIRSMRRDFADVDGPERAANGGDVLWVMDLLVAEELRPSTIRGIAEIMGRFAGCVPASGGLRRVLPQKGKAGIGVAVGDHVAGDGASVRASSRTRFGASSIPCPRGGA